MAVLIVLVHFLMPKKGEISSNSDTHLLIPFVFQMLLYGTETNTFHKEWKIIAIVLRVAKLLMSPSIFESETQKWAICAWFQFLPSTEMFDFRTKTLQITR